MPTPEYDVSIVPDTTDVLQQFNACPAPLTPPPESNQHHESVPLRERQLDGSRQEAICLDNLTMNNNTGAGMAQSQEDSMYITPDASPELFAHAVVGLEANDKMDAMQEENATNKSVQSIDVDRTTESSSEEQMCLPRTPISPATSSDHLPLGLQPSLVRTAVRGGTPNHLQYQTNEGDSRRKSSAHQASTYQEQRNADQKSYTRVEIPKIDLELDWNSPTTAQDFTRKRHEPRYPSSLFQCDSRFSGTQQSDRQIYHVNVRILTIDMDQSTCTGYLLIKGLTPEHDTLQTYFTGEIIGGPGQKYGFRTKNPEWGASEKTDRGHWGRFPAWRSYSAYAKQDLDFAWPLNGLPWSAEEVVFMRWKEHFLVPDHKTKSIAGASFEGFYYICLNQVEGRISGIYFHSKSEKYQQLELKHDGEPGIWHRGVTPAIELR